MPETRSFQRIFIVDAQPVVREGLAHRLGRSADLRVCGEADNASEAQKAIARRKPDLVIMDLDLPGGSGLELIKNLAALHPQLAILVFSRHDERLYAQRVLGAGAHGYLDKRTPGPLIVEAIRRVLAGEAYISRTASAAVFQSLGGRRSKPSQVHGASLLTDRELEVLQLVGEARATRLIARQLAMSVKTVEAHRAAIKRKLELRTGPELTRYAVLWVESGGDLAEGTAQPRSRVAPNGRASARARPMRG